MEGCRGGITHVISKEVKSSALTLRSGMYTKTMYYSHNSFIINYLTYDIIYFCKI